MLILKEKLGKSAEHWKTVRKNADLSPGLSLLLSLDLFLLIVSGKQQKYKHIDKKRINNKHTKIKNNVYVFLCSSDFHFLPKCFLQNQHVAAKFHLFVFYLFIFFSESSVESLFSSCLYVVYFLFVWFVLNFQLFVWIIYIYIYVLCFDRFLFFIVFLDFFGVLWGIRVHNACVHSSFRDDEIYHPLFFAWGSHGIPCGGTFVQ